MGIFKVLQNIFVIIPFVVPFALLLEETSKPGTEKKAEVVALLKKEIGKLGLGFPAWIDKFIDPLLGVIVDVVVSFMNQTGFFTHSQD